MKMKCSGPGVFMSGHLVALGSSVSCSWGVSSGASLVDFAFEVVQARVERALFAPDDRHPREKHEPHDGVCADEQRLAAVVLALALHGLKGRRPAVGIARRR